MKEQQERARASAVKGGSQWVCKMKPLQNITVESVFNYNAKPIVSKLVAIVADNAEVEAVSEGTASTYLCGKRHSTLKWVDR